MNSLAVRLENRPGALAEMGRILGKAGVSIEGGGIWMAGDVACGHFLFRDGEVARRVLEHAGIKVLGVYPVQVQELDQERPGQLGEFCGRMAAAGVNIEAMYSDHANQLVLVVDDEMRAREVAETWMAGRRD